MTEILTLLIMDEQLIDKQIELNDLLEEKLNLEEALYTSPQNQECIRKRVRIMETIDKIRHEIGEIEAFKD